MSLLSSTSGSALSSFLTASSTLSVGGLISGLNTNQIIQGLLAVDQQKITDINTKVSAIQAQQTAFKTVEAKLLALQTQISHLSTAQNSIFDARTAQVSDSNLVSAAASSSAVPGDYHFRVNNLALANQIASQGFDSATSAMNHGTLSITVGAKTTDITVDANNDTLQGLASAVNTAGVNAVVVNDGSGNGQQAYRLLLKSTATGTANQIKIASTPGSSGNPSKLVFDAGSIGNVISSANNTGTSAVQSSAGAAYTGNSNDVYSFTVVQGGAVGTDDNLQIAYTNSDGTHSGTITVNHADVGTLKQVAQGIGVHFSAGTLVAGDTFKVKGFVPTVQAAADASITLGSGSGALTVTSSSNTVNTLIPGVTLSLKSANPSEDITLSVANDTATITQAIQGFVSSYNDVADYIAQQTSYDSTTNTGGPLLGNSQVIDIEERLQSVVQNVVPGASPRLNYLGALGITTDDNGDLTLDTTKLANILSGNQTGVTLADVRKLFSTTGSTSDPAFTFVGAGAKTRATTTPYTVNITQAAQQAALTATSPLAASTVIDDSNNTLVVGVDSTTSSTLTLANGTYTQAALAQAVQTAINGDSTLGGRQVNVSVVNNNLTITSNSYGRTSRVVVQSGTSLPTLGFAASASAQGQDVAGSFVVAGVTETATGTAQFLIGDPGNAHTAGLNVRVNLTPTQVGSGAQADVNVSLGIASQVTSVLNSLFDPVNGRLKTIDDNYDTQLLQLAKDRTAATDFVNTRQQQLENQFNAMEQNLAQLQAAGNIIALQQAALNQKK